MKIVRNFAIGAVAAALFAGGFAFRGTVSKGEEKHEAAPSRTKVKPPVVTKLTRPVRRNPRADGPSKRRNDLHSHGLLALREAFMAKDPFKMHANIQKFEAGEFDEVWTLLLTLPDGGWKNQEMELAVLRASNLGQIDEVLDRLVADIPPGTSRESLLKYAFSATKVDLAGLNSKAEAFTDPGEKKAIFVGISDRIARSKSLAELDPDIFRSGSPELLEALAKGLGKYSSAFTFSVSDEEKDAKMADAVAFAEKVVSSGLGGKDFLAGMIAELSSDRVVEVWDYLQETRPGLIENNPDILRPVLRSMISQDPQEVLALSLKHPWIESAAMRGATLSWLARDSTKAEEWFEAHAETLEGDRTSQVAAGFAEFHGHRGNPEEAQLWLERIPDPKVRDELSTRLNGWPQKGY